MKKRIFLTGLLFLFAVEAVILLLFTVWDADDRQDSARINEIVQTVQADWDALSDGGNPSKEQGELPELSYAVLDREGTVLLRTDAGVSTSINAAVVHRDTMLDLVVDGETVGKIIIANDSEQIFKKRKQTFFFVILAVTILQCGICAGYYVYLNYAVIEPFQKLNGFAQRIAGGNLDVPLEMDRANIFGAFTESFDIMRSELKKAKIAEAKANAGKKELVAKLSHDIKTPVASIKAASEVGAALADSDRLRDNYTQIIRKADQIDTLISDLFTAALEELRQLTVSPGDMESRGIREMLESADYLHYAVISEIPECMLYADRLRLQQVFDNIFANSYKYAGTQVDVTAHRKGERLDIRIEDQGGGVCEEKLPLLREKFKRGSNAKDVEGAGLGLYISDYFMKEMNGELVIENGERGLAVTVCISLNAGVL